MTLKYIFHCLQNNVPFFLHTKTTSSTRTMFTPLGEPKAGKFVYTSMWFYSGFIIDDTKVSILYVRLIKTLYG